MNNHKTNPWNTSRLRLLQATWQEQNALLTSQGINTTYVSLHATAHGILGSPNGASSINPERTPAEDTHTLAAPFPQRYLNPTTHLAMELQENYFDMGLLLSTDPSFPNETAGLERQCHQTLLDRRHADPNKYLQERLQKLTQELTQRRPTAPTDHFTIMVNRPWRTYHETIRLLSLVPLAQLWITFPLGIELDQDLPPIGIPRKNRRYLPQQITGDPFAVSRLYDIQEDPRQAARLQPCQVMDYYAGELLKLFPRVEQSPCRQNQEYGLILASTDHAPVNPALRAALEHSSRTVLAHW